MKLIGMLDSPYVRRVAISLQLLGIEFEHEALSVFRTFAEFQAINPLVKAPTLICDDGVVLMESSLILEFAEAIANPRTLLPKSLGSLQRDLRVTGLALVAMEKSVQLVYEQELRPAEKRHEPWVERVNGQLIAAYDQLDRELKNSAFPVDEKALTQSGITTVVAWTFTQNMLPHLVSGQSFQSVDALSAHVERFPSFIAAPHGEGTVLRK